MSRGKPKARPKTAGEEAFERVGLRRRRYTEEFKAEAVQMLLAVSFFLDTRLVRCAIGWGCRA